MRCRFVGLFVGAIIALRSATAQADDDSDLRADHDARAEELFRLSREAAKRGDYLTACAGFRESQSLVATAGTLLNLADCEERAGKLTQALADFEEVQRELAASDPRAQLAVVRSTGLSARVARVTVALSGSTSPEGVRIKIEPTGQNVSIGSPLRLDPGEYRIVLQSADGSERSIPITLHEGEAKEVVATAPSPPPQRFVADTPEQPAPRGHKVLELAAFAGGSALLALGTGTGIAVAAEAATYKKHCTPGCDATGASAASVGRVLGVLSPVALGLGAVGVGFGFYLLVARHREHVRVSAVPTTGGAIVGARISF